MHLIELFLEERCREITSDINWKSNKKNSFQFKLSFIYIFFSLK